MSKNLFILLILISTIKLNAQKINTGHLGKYHLVNVSMSNYFGVNLYNYMAQKIHVEIEKQYKPNLHLYLITSFGQKNYTQANWENIYFDVYDEVSQTYKNYDLSNLKFGSSNLQFEIGSTFYRKKFGAKFPYGRFYRFGIGATLSDITSERDTFNKKVFEAVKIKSEYYFLSYEAGNRFLIGENLFIQYGMLVKAPLSNKPYDETSSLEVVVKSLAWERIKWEDVFRLKIGIGFAL